MLLRQSEIMIEARALAYDYSGEEEPSSPALSGINLDVHRGEYLALIGPNGSGKTTLLKLFNALLAPTDGEVRVEGISTVEEENIPRIRRTCGMIFQNPDNQLVATTVEEDIAFGLENLALPSAEIRQKVGDVARLLGLEDLLQQPPHLLSGGEKQRVSLARCLLKDRKIVIFDEATSALDKKNEAEVQASIDAIRKELGAVTTVVIAHRLSTIRNADKIIVLKKGKLTEIGTHDTLLREHPDGVYAKLVKQQEDTETG
jgi:energy-coupling factor transporter ATP-binding protein EcfA2